MNDLRLCLTRLARCCFVAAALAEPSSEFLPVVPAPAPVHLDHNEMKFQVSVKAALVRDLPLVGGDLWFAYTQQSNWQVWNGAISRPFRETN